MVLVIKRTSHTVVTEVLKVSMPMAGETTGVQLQLVTTSIHGKQIEIRQTCHYSALIIISISLTFTRYIQYSTAAAMKIAAPSLGLG